MNDSVIVFDQLVILQNYQILQKKDTDIECKKWVDEIKKIQSMYNLDTKYLLNKTILIGYPTKETHLIPLDVFLNHSTIVVPKTCINFVDTYLVSIINYLTATIKISCCVEIANEMKYKCIIYLPNSHKDHEKLRGSPFIITFPGIHKKTSLGRILTEEHSRYEFIFQFRDDFSIVPYQSSISSFFGNSTNSMKME